MYPYIVGWGGGDFRGDKTTKTPNYCCQSEVRTECHKQSIINLCNIRNVKLENIVQIKDTIQESGNNSTSHLGVKILS